MNPSSRALIWELWRKNRWGFAIVLVLFVTCFGSHLYVNHLQRRVTGLQAKFYEQSSGSFKLTVLLPSAAGLVQPAPGQIQIGTVHYEGVLSPGDELAWKGELSGGVSPVLRVTLGELELCAAEPLPNKISVSVTQGGLRTVTFLPAREAAESAGAALAGAETWRQLTLGWSLVTLSFSILVLFAVFGAAEPHGARGFTGIPTRRFTLPVATGTLVLWPVLLGTAGIILVTAAWSWLVLQPLLLDSARVPWLYLASLFSAGLVLFQALVWGLPSFPRTRTVLITALMLAVLSLAILPVDSRGGTAEWWRKMESPMLLWLPLVWAGACGAAWLGASLERQGRWAGCSPLAAFQKTLARPLLRDDPFASPAQAQLWLEWRRNGRLPLAVWTVGVWIVLGIHAAAEVSWPDLKPFATNLLALAPLPAAVWIAVAGLNAARDGATGKLALSTFSAVLPVRTGSLLQAKLQAAGRLWLAAVLVLGASWLMLKVAITWAGPETDGLYAFFGAEAGVAREPVPFLVRTEAAALVGMLLGLSIHLFVGILPLCLAGRIPGFPWSLLPLLLAYGVVVNSLPFAERTQLRAETVFWLLLLLLLGKLLLGYWGLRRSVLAQIVTARFAAGYLAFWLLAAGGLVWLAWRGVERAGWTFDSMMLVAAAALVMPLARIAWAPLALAVNRHR